MAANLSTTGASSEPNAWHELEDVFSGLGQLARSPVAPTEFYRMLLDECVRALAANGGAVWLRESDSFRPIAQLRWPGAARAGDEDWRRAHEVLLRKAASRGEVQTIASDFKRHQSSAASSIEDSILLGPVRMRSEAEQSATAAIIELSLPADASPATYRGCEQFLAAVCDLAVDYHAFHELHRLRNDDAYRDALLNLANQVHRQLGLSETAYAVVNEGRRVVECDRLSVLTARGTRSRLLAMSGISRVEWRSGAVRRIEELAELVRRSNEPVFYAGGHCDALPPVAEALERHAEESHARQVAAIPVDWPGQAAVAEGERQPTALPQRRDDRPMFVLVAEQFDAQHGELHRYRFAEVAQVCATALYNAQQFDQLPLGWLMRPLGELKYYVATHLSRTAIAIVAVTACVAALVFVPADFTIESPGTLEPAVRRDIFAPRSGLAEEVLVAHGAEVAAGQPLVRLHDPQLELELKRVDGELETTQRQIDAVRAARTNRQIRDTKPADGYRLSAEERELEQRLTNLRREKDLLNQEREALVVTSPIAGRVLSWDLAHRLATRPVERGEVLVTVADLSADWQLKLAVPDDRIGHVLAARQSLRPDLPVRFRLSSDDGQQHEGHIVEVSRTADVNPQETSPSPTVQVTVALDALNVSEAARRELRPGVSARAKIDCGRRSLGYVWLHDLWDAAMEWLWF
jgi:multidrug efflux pump subunit AcrA (membrane-fusion protein)